MNGLTRAFFALAFVAAQCCCTRRTLEASPIDGTTLPENHEPVALENSTRLEEGIGSPLSEWYLSLKTSKGYCGLVAATATAGGYGFAVACNNKYPQYGYSFAVLLPDGSSSGGGGAAAAAAGNALQKHDGVGTAGGLLADASAPVVVTSGQAVRLLSRSAGLCNSPPTLLPSPRTDRAVPTTTTTATRGVVYVPYVGSFVLHAARTVHWWLDVVRCGLVRVLRCSEERIPGGCERGSGAANGSGGACGGSSCGAGSWCRWWCEGCRRSRTAPVSGDDKEDGAGYGAASATVRDAPPRAIICSLGQPSTLSYKIFKSDLKDGVSVDLDKEWIYLKEGDKYCTLADVAGLSAVISCHMDYPGWSGYKFQLQTVSYPRSQLHSLLTGSPCGVRLPGLPGPHDVECQAGEQPGREAEVELVLQTPGSVLAAGVVVGFSTFSPGLMGVELQRCCALVASPHILLCEPPSPASMPVANECWFQMYDVKIESSPRPRNSGAATKEITEAAAASGSHGAAAAGAGDGEMASEPRVITAARKGTHSAAERVRGSSGFSTFLLSFLRSMQLEMSPAGLDPDLLYEYAAPDVLPLDSDSVAGRPEDATAAAAEGSGSSSLLGRWWAKQQRRLLPLPRIELELVVGVEAAGGTRTEQSQADGGEEEEEGSGGTLWGVSGRATRRPHSWDHLDSQPDPQSQVEEQRSDGGAEGGDGIRDGADGAVVARNVVSAQAAAIADAEATASQGQLLATRHWNWLRAWAVGASAPLGDGSLVMLLSRAFGRYCSVSLDGTLLCVSAQASNASRNLFTLIMPPAAQAARAPAATAAAVVKLEPPGGGQVGRGAVAE